MKRRFIRKQIRQRIPKKTNFVRIPAIMGDGDGNIAISEKPGYVWIRFLNGEPWPVYNGGAAPEIENYKIWIGTDADMPLRMHVLSLQDVYQEPGDGNEFDPTTLSWPGRNTLWVWGEQFLPGLARPIAGTLQIQFLPWKPVIDGTIVQIRSQTIDFSSYVPASGALWLLVEYDNTGTLNIVEGTAYASRSLLSVARIPSPTAGSRHFWAIRVYETMTEFAWRPAKNDLVDLRWGSSVTGAGGLPYDPADVNDWDYLTDPGDVGDALDQIASRVTDIESGGIEGLQYRALVTVSDGSGGWEFVTADGEPVRVLQNLE